MRRTASILFFLSFCFSVSGQSQVEKATMVEFPKSYGVVSVINQPDAPIQFKEVQLFTSQQGKFPSVRYLIENRTRKEVVSFAVEFHQRSRVKIWAPYSDGWVETTGNKNAKIVILSPGGTYENVQKETLNVFPFDKALIDILDPKMDRPRLLTLWVGFIKRVNFNDGTEYDCGFSGDDIEAILFGEK